MTVIVSKYPLHFPCLATLCTVISSPGIDCIFERGFVSFIIVVAVESLEYVYNIKVNNKNIFSLLKVSTNYLLRSLSIPFFIIHTHSSL